MEPRWLCFKEVRELSKAVRELEMIVKVPKIEVLCRFMLLCKLIHPKVK
jgi:hypothetical protein